MLNVLFLCTGNSCRSVMAEGILRSLGRGRFFSYSAGSNPTNEVHPLSLKTLNDHQMHDGEFYSKSWDKLADIDFDIVITVCDSAANETCPVYLRGINFAHWPDFDPPKINVKLGEEQEPVEKAFQILKRKIEALVDLDISDSNFRSKFSKIASLN
ncbi:arsenate reductase ArsC [bacterium]|nr:arsenate reductase ArsC [bacterium]